jgi:O-antigen/teichoic acid export membrane protein
VTLPEQTVKQRVASGLAWESSTKLAVQILSWAVTVFVARVLSPSDYGLVAISGIFTLFLQLFADFGIGSGLVTRKAVSARETSIVFWFNLYVCIGLYALLYACAPLIAAAYGLPPLTDIVRVAGLGLLITAFRTVPMSLALRTLDYRARAIAEMAGNAVQSLATLALAYGGAGAWSLVVGFLLGQLVTTAFFLSHLRGIGPPVLSFGPVRDILAFGTRLTLSRAANHLVAMADMIIVSARLGERASGLYLMALTFANAPLDKLGSIVNRVTFPAVARVQDSPAAVRNLFLSAHFWLLLVAAPMLTGAALVADDVVAVLFPPTWSETGTILSQLCAANVFRLSGMVMPAFLEGLRHARLLLQFTTFNGIVMIPAFLVGSKWGVTGVAWAWALTAPVIWCVLVTITLARLGVRWREFAGSILTVVAAVALMCVCVLGAARGITGHSVLVHLLAQVAAGAVAYALAIVVLVPRARWHQLRSLVRPPDAAAPPAKEVLP